VKLAAAAAAAQMAVERREAVLWLWTKVKVHFRLYGINVSHFESKECLGQICALRHFTVLRSRFTNQNPFQIKRVIFMILPDKGSKASIRIAVFV
jgi:hypothetical protein